MCPRLYFTCPPPLWGWVASVSETEGGISAMVNGRMMDTLRRRGDSSWHPAISDYARFAGIGRLGQAPSTTSWSPSPIDGGGKCIGARSPSSIDGVGKGFGECVPASSSAMLKLDRGGIRI